MRTLCFFYILLCFFFFVLYGGLVVIVDAAFTFQSISPTNPTPGTQAELVYEVVDQAVRPSLGLIWLNVTANGNTLSTTSNSPGWSQCPCTDSENFLFCVNWPCRTPFNDYPGFSQKW